MIHNGVHGSDTPENAIREIHLLFPRVVKKSRSSFMARPTSGATREQAIALATAAGANPDEVAKMLEALSIQQRTLALIKPDAYGSGKKQDIVNKITQAGFKIALETEFQLTKEKACEFYKEHSDKPFYEDLTNWMSR